MKVAVLILVLANLVLFAWLRLSDNPPSNEPLAPVAQTASQVVLLSGAPVTAAEPATARALLPQTSSAPSGVAAAPRHSSGNPQCLVWGPFAATTATQFAAKLEGRNVSVQDFTRLVKVAVAYRVELTGFSDPGAARRVEAAIRKGGITDLYILDKSDVHHPVLSLGLFHERSGARQRAVRARKLGFRPTIRAIKRKRAYHFLQLRLPVAASVVAALRERGGERRSRHAACVSPSATAIAPVEASAP